MNADPGGAQPRPQYAAGFAVAALIVVAFALAQGGLAGPTATASPSLVLRTPAQVATPAAPTSTPTPVPLTSDQLRFHTFGPVVSATPRQVPTP
ncbi:MAG: hypothetical protein ACHQZR_04210 [Candidatus Limnocylindrales bacterium]